MSEFPKTGLNRINRKPARGQYDRGAIYPILDEALVCYVGFNDGEQPVVIPTLHARVGDTLYLHGAPASRMLKILQAEPDAADRALLQALEAPEDPLPLVLRDAGAAVADLQAHAGARADHDVDRRLRPEIRDRRAD